MQTHTLSPQAKFFFSSQNIYDRTIWIIVLPEDINKHIYSENRSSVHKTNANDNQMIFIKYWIWNLEKFDFWITYVVWRNVVVYLYRLGFKKSW